MQRCTIDTGVDYDRTVTERHGHARADERNAVDGRGPNALMGPSHGLRARGLWNDAPGTSGTSGAMACDDACDLRDGKYVCIALLERNSDEALIDLAEVDR